MLFWSGKRFRSVILRPRDNLLHPPQILRYGFRTARPGGFLMPDNSENRPSNLVLRHQEEAAKERSACGYRYRLLSKGDEDVAAWAHAVDIDGAKPHYHKRATELYYVLEGEGSVVLDGEEREVRTGTIVHIPPGVVHGAVGKMRVLVVGIPDIDDSDVYYPDAAESAAT